MADYKLNWRLKPEHRLTDEQFDAILDAAAGSLRDMMLIFLPGNTGLRISEVLHIHVADFERGSGLRIVRRKKKVLDRDVLSIANEVFTVIEEYTTENKLGPKDWLFPGEVGPCYRNVVVGHKKEGGEMIPIKQNQRMCDGGHLSIRRAQQLWDRALLKAGLKVKGRGVHTLRHYDATRFYRKTRDMRATQIRLGHTSPLVTQVYADVVDMQDKADQAGISGGSAMRRRRK